MPRSDNDAQRIAASFSLAISLITQDQLDELMRRVSAGEDPRLVIQELQETFADRFTDRLAQSFAQLLERAVSIAEVRSMSIAGVTLSRKLYRYALQTSAEVLAVLRQHVSGVHQARELALSLYDGYSPQDGIRRPLEGRARAELPKALRALTADPQARKSLTRLIEQGQAQAARLKSSALRAAYLEAFQTWEKGSGEGALRRRLDVAVKEKNRYFATRIAQTELARAHQSTVAAEILDDPQLTVVQVALNPAHPKKDICDFHARVDLYGLGPGLYPKGKAPRPPYHPFCWCRLRPRPSLTALAQRAAPGGASGFLRAMPVAEAARLMGSRERAEEVMSGADVLEVVNRGVPDDYKTRPLEKAAVHPLVKRRRPVPA